VSGGGDVAVTMRRLAIGDDAAAAATCRADGLDVGQFATMGRSAAE